MEENKIIISPTKRSKIALNTRRKQLQYNDIEFLYSKEIHPFHLYKISKNSMKIGDWVMFYNQPSKILEINGTQAKILTKTIVTKDDAEFLNEIKGKEYIKEGDEGEMTHSFSLKQLQKIEKTTNRTLKIGICGNCNEEKCFEEFLHCESLLPIISDKDIEDFIKTVNIDKLTLH